VFSAIAGAAANTPATDTATISLESQVLRILSPNSLYTLIVICTLIHPCRNIGVFYGGALFFHVPIVLGEHHLLMAIARGHHGKAVFLGLNDDVQEIGTRVGHALCKRRIELGGVLHPGRAPAERPGERDEVGNRRVVAVTVAPVVDELLPLAHHAHVLVVAQYHLDGRLVLAGC